MLMRYAGCPRDLKIFLFKKKVSIIIMDRGCRPDRDTITGCCDCRRQHKLVHNKMIWVVWVVSFRKGQGFLEAGNFLLHFAHTQGNCVNFANKFGRGHIEILF